MEIEIHRKNFNDDLEKLTSKPSSKFISGENYEEIKKYLKDASYKVSPSILKRIKKHKYRLISHPSLNIMDDVICIPCEVCNFLISILFFPIFELFLLCPKFEYLILIG